MGGGGAGLLGWLSQESGGGVVPRGRDWNAATLGGLTDPLALTLALFV